jgi:DNA-binding transcriptional LysR family regulator
VPRSLSPGGYRSGGDSGGPPTGLRASSTPRHEIIQRGHHDYYDEIGNVVSSATNALWTDRRLGPLKLEYMAEFVVLAETLNFTVTAERLFVTQPVLTRHVQAIEAEYGAHLLDRTTHNVVLTDEGRLALDHFRQILAQADDLKAELAARRAGIVGALTIGAQYYGLHEWLGPILAVVEERYPLLRVEVLSFQPHEIIAGLKDGSLNLGMTIRTAALPPEQFLFQRLASLDLYAIRWRDPSRQIAQPLPIERLADEVQVVSSHDAELTGEQRAILDQFGVQPRAVVDAGQIDLVPQKLRSSGGFFIGPALLRPMAPDDLDFQPLDSSPPCRMDLGVIARIGLGSPAMSTFLSVCAEFADRHEGAQTA